jgi:hypothetical protein
LEEPESPKDPDYIDHIVNLANDDLPIVDSEYIIIEISKLSLLLLYGKKKGVNLWGLGKRAFALCFKGEYTRDLVHFIIANKVTTHKELLSISQASDQHVRYTIKEMLNAGFIKKLGTVDLIYGANRRPANLFGLKSASEKDILAAKRRYAKIDTVATMTAEKKEVFEPYINKLIEIY